MRKVKIAEIFQLMPQYFLHSRRPTPWDKMVLFIFSGSFSPQYCRPFAQFWGKSMGQKFHTDNSRAKFHQIYFTSGMNKVTQTPQSVNLVISLFYLMEATIHFVGYLNRNESKENLMGKSTATHPIFLINRNLYYLYFIMNTMQNRLGSRLENIVSKYFRMLNIIHFSAWNSGHFWQRAN